MFEKFTDKARRVVVLAQEEAKMLNHNYIGTEHLLLGLIHEGEGVAAKSLEALGISLDAVREQVTVEARKQKKGEMLIEKMNATGAKSIDDMASKLNTAAMDADNVSFSSPFVPGLGNEPKLVGTAFGLKAGQLSKPVAGDNGVCVLFVKSFTEPTATTDFSSSGKQMADQRRARSEYEVLNALKESAGIEDNRGKFY